MAGRAVLDKISSSHWQQDTSPLPSTSNYSSPSRSWISSSRAQVSPQCLASQSNWRHGDLYPAFSFGWGTTKLASCRLRSCPAKIITPGKRRLSRRIVSESMNDDGGPKDNEVKTFIKTLGPKATARTTGSEILENSPTGKSIWTWNPLVMLDRIADHADAQTELGMKTRGAFYKAEDWFGHRSSKRHLRHILSTFKSRVIISLIPPVTALTAIAAGVAVYNTLAEDLVLPSFFPVLHTSTLPYQLTAPALALLLVFRTEASYSRYDEGRKTWTKVFACTKDFSRQSLAWIQNPKDFHQRMDLQHYIMAFPVALKIDTPGVHDVPRIICRTPHSAKPYLPSTPHLYFVFATVEVLRPVLQIGKCHLLDGSDIYEDLKLLLDAEDLAVVMASQHRPNCLIQLMTQSLTLVQVSDNQRSLMETNITEFNHSVSVCERITRTPIPLSYTRLTSRALVLWHLTLPLVLWDDCKWMVVFATFFSASTLFCIEEVGVLIEEPFPMLSLDKMCAVAHQNVQELVEMSRVAENHLKTKEKIFRNSAGTGTGDFARLPSNGVSPKSSN